MEVYQYLGKDTVGGQGDIEITWKWLCRDSKKMVIVSECKTWGYCSPDLQKFREEIIEGKEFADYFFTNICEVKNCIGDKDSRKSCKRCDDYERCSKINKDRTVLADVNLPITANMIREGKFNL